MNTRFAPTALVLVASVVLASSVPTSAQKLPKGFVSFVRCPDGGEQPRVGMTEDGTLHVVYSKGDPATGDLYHVSSRDDGDTFTDPIRVNSRTGSVDASTNASGARVEVDRRGRVHVVWLGASGAVESLPEESRVLFYSRRIEPDGDFEPQRVLSGEHHGLDAAPTVLEAWKRVFVFWHAPGETTAEATPAEPGRRIYMTVSDDFGDTFSEPKAIDSGAHGVSSACGIAAEAQAQAPLLVLYRSRDGVDRDVRYLVSEDKGETFESKACDNERTRISPRTNVALARLPGKLYAAWGGYETVWWTPINDGTRFVPGKPRAKKTRWLARPSIETSTRNATLLAWIEGDSPGEADSIGWQGFDSIRRSSIGRGSLDGIDMSTYPALFLRADGTRFRIIY